MVFSNNKFSENLFELITEEIWKFLVPPEDIQRHIKSLKRVFLFLDKNDSDFQVYLLKNINKYNSINYYADYYKYKKTQTSFTQNLMSLLFLEAINTKTRKVFAEDIIRISNKVLSSKQIPVNHRKKIKKYSSIFEVFSSLFYGRGERKDLCIKLLKCMSCNWYFINEWFGLYGDFTDPEFLQNFFCDILQCFYLSSELKGKYSEKKIVFCIGNIPYENFETYDLKEICMMYNFDEIFNKIKFIFITKNIIPEMYVRSFKYYTDVRNYVDEVSYITTIPLLSDKYDIEDLSIKIIEILTKNYSHNELFSKINITDRTLEYFSDLLHEHYDKGITVLNLSQGLTTLLGHNILNPDKKITRNIIKTLFYSI